MDFSKFRFKKRLAHSSSLRHHINPDARPEKECLSAELEENIRKIKNALGNSTDLVIRKIRIGQEAGIDVVVLYTDGLVDTQLVQKFLEMFMVYARDVEIRSDAAAQRDILSILKDLSPIAGDVKEIEDFETLFPALLSGNTVILFDGQKKGVFIGTQGWEDRGVTESTVESVVRGPHEAFSESLRTNTALIRRKIKDQNLWLESFEIGRVTKTNVAMMYLKGIVNEKVVEEVRERLERIDIDGILESGNIEELIQDETFTPFPTIFNTERPDKVAAGLLEGRVAILVDGTPVVLLVPIVFTEFLQASEDYYNRSDFGILRFLRFAAFLISLLGPSVYIAITTFHQEMLPSTLLMSIASQREAVPFPAAVEALLMEITFEILREAGIRMPRVVGSAISIVGAIVLGEAAVQAGLVSPAMVIVVAITAISSFVIPSFSMAIAVRILRFVLMGAAASLGIYGIFIVILIILLHLCSLRSFGIPYMAPLAPLNLEDQKDTIFRLPLWMLHTRPHLISQNNIVRESNWGSKKPGYREDNSESR